MRTRKRKRWRARGSFLTSVLVAGASTYLPAASALMDGSAPLRTMSQSSIQTHGSACGGGWLGLGPGAWHPLDPSWAPMPVLRGRLNILEARGQGLGVPWTLPGCQSVVRQHPTDHGSCGGGSACAYCRGTDRGMPVPQIMPVRGGGQLVRHTSTGAVLGQGC